MRRLLDDIAALGQSAIGICLLFLLVCVLVAPLLRALGIWT
jgi:hypothetical protein